MLTLFIVALHPFRAVAFAPAEKVVPGATIFMTSPTLNALGLFTVIRSLLFVELPFQVKPVICWPDVSVNPAPDNVILCPFDKFMVGTLNVRVVPSADKAVGQCRRWR